MRYGEAGQSHLLPFLGAAALFAALTITAHSVVLGLAAVIAGPVPAAQTALSLSRKAVSGAAQEEAASVAEAAPESTGTAASQPEAAAPTGGIESYLVELLGDDARPEGAGAVIEKNYPQGSGEKYVACGAGSIKNNTRQTAADIAAEIQTPLPFGVEKDSPDPQILIMHTHATEDYRLSAGLWYSPGDGARTTDTNLNMCAVGRVMADTLNAAGLNTLHDETLNDYPSYTGSYENSRAVVQRYLAQYPSIKVVLDVHRDAIETEGGSRMAPVCTVDGRQAAQVMIICGCDNGGSVRLPGWRQNLRFAAAWERSMEEATKNNDGLHFQIAINYGGRDEIVRAVKKLSAKVQSGEVDPAGITADTLEGYLDTAGIPDPDLLIRTCNEQRISNFLLWQLAYTEFYFTPVPWPDFTKEELIKAVEAYNHRDRRYGGLKEE